MSVANPQVTQKQAQVYVTKLNAVLDVPREGIEFDTSSRFVLNADGQIAFSAEGKSADLPAIIEELHEREILPREVTYDTREFSSSEVNAEKLDGTLVDLGAENYYIARVLSQRGYRAFNLTPNPFFNPEKPQGKPSHFITCPITESEFASWNNDKTVPNTLQSLRDAGIVGMLEGSVISNTEQEPAHISILPSVVKRDKLWENTPTTQPTWQQRTATTTTAGVNDTPLSK